MDRTGAGLDTPSGSGTRTGDDYFGGMGRGHQTVIGGLLLALAGLLLLLTPAAQSPGLSGVASPIQLPEEPAIGTCVNLPDRTSATPGVPTFVSCDEPHDGELTRVFPAGTAPTMDNSGVTAFIVSSEPVFGPVRDQDWTVCQPWTDTYIGVDQQLTVNSANSAWAIPGPYGAATLIVGSPDDSYQRYAWSACVVTPPFLHERYTGSVADAGHSSGQPALSVFMSCLGPAPPDGTGALTTTSCSTPHLAEVIGWDLNWHTRLSTEDVRQQCAHLAAGITGARDPTYNGQLTIEVKDVIGLIDPGRAQAAAASQEPVAQDCVVELARSGSLIGSVVALGDQPLPVVP